MKRATMPLTMAELRNLKTAVDFRLSCPWTLPSRKIVWRKLMDRLDAQEQKLKMIEKLERQKMRLAKSTKGRARK